MTTIAESFRGGKIPWSGIAAGLGFGLLVAAFAIPNVLRSRAGLYAPSAVARHEPLASYSAATLKAKPVAFLERSQAASASLDAAAGRKIIRTGSLEMVVQHPAEVAEKIAALAESMGGYVVSSQGGGENATSGLLTIRVPAAHYDQARVDIRKLGLHVESETLDAQDVTRQYVDQDASIRNLKAEEAQYLTILRQANTVKDLLAVSEKLSEVRGQIEQQQAEFNALSQQIDTVALTISLRTESEQQVLGLDWRPGVSAEAGPA
jgi:hypothetical protein